ncbi:hypothetical protein BKA62DRAFT_717244 [Auriculariales sp. MPI-PUGE-AT-0066]|nr:hypothetical protein BKA62DRAFT_717244 [Auriculariales sp. MPI-PUGE-AT-0066]
MRVHRPSRKKVEERHREELTSRDALIAQLRAQLLVQVASLEETASSLGVAQARVTQLQNGIVDLAAEADRQDARIAAQELEIQRLNSTLQLSPPARRGDTLVTQLGEQVTERDATVTPAESAQAMNAQADGDGSEFKAASNESRSHPAATSQVQDETDDAVFQLPPTHRIASYPNMLHVHEYALYIPSGKVAIVRAQSYSWGVKRLVVSTNPTRLGFPLFMESQYSPSHLHLADEQGDTLTVEGDIWITFSTESRQIGVNDEWQPASNQLISQRGDAYRIGVKDQLLADGENIGEYGDAVVSVELVSA